MKFSFDFLRDLLKSKREIELEAELKAYQNRENQASQAMTADLSTKPYKKLIQNFTNKSVTVIFHDDEIVYTTLENVEKIRNAVSKEDVLYIIADSSKRRELSEIEAEKQEIEQKKIEKELVSHFLDIFKDNQDFEVDEVRNELFFKGVKTVPVPHVIVAAFIEALTNKNEQEYESLKNFTLKLLTSPRKESIEQVLTFCRNNDMRITKRGNIIAYRRVKKYSDVKMPDNKELLNFVKQSVDKVKKSKKSPKNYEIYSSSEGYLLLHKDKETTETHLGNLYEMYNNQSALTDDAVQLYTSRHNYGKYTFAIGDIYTSEEGDIDLDAGNCAAGGLHFAAVDYNYNSFGEVPVVVLVNPAKTITIPLNEMQKGRTTEMKIACINPNPHGVHIDEALIEKADEEYDEYTTNELLEVIKTKNLEPLSVSEEVTQLSIPEIKNITELLKNRIVLV